MTAVRMYVTNPGIPPALSKAHHEESSERVQSLKAELARFLETLDEVLEAPAPTPPRDTSTAA